ncbi:MAG TPA: hypothetical protein GX696_00910 [Pseudomonadaceae bacterium]|nr:hypothetical protein [Pseudomonadaceae bacterium]
MSTKLGAIQVTLRIVQGALEDISIDPGEAVRTRSELLRAVMEETLADQESRRSVSRALEDAYTVI